MLKYQTHLIVVSVASSVFNDTTSDPKQIPTATQIKFVAGCVSIPDFFAFNKAPLCKCMHLFNYFFLHNLIDFIACYRNYHSQNW